jgi:DNA-binding MarR family transcriptional regulator
MDQQADLGWRLARRFGDVLPSFMTVLRQRFCQAGLPQGLSWPQVLMLRGIGADEVQPSELARHFLMSGAAVTSLIDGLVQKGLVDRRHDERDRRTVRLSLTAQGQQVRGAVDDLMMGVLHELLGCLPPERQERLLVALDDLEILTQHFPEGERRHGRGSCPSPSR